MKKYIIQSIVCVYLILFCGSIQAQKIHSNTLTTKNYLDSVNIKTRLIPKELKSKLIIFKGFQVFIVKT
jgi:hypothetical protein